MPHFRIDRVLTLKLFKALAGKRAATGPRIPILMYHSISYDEGPSTEKKHPYYATTTTPPVFRRHLQILRQMGYHSIGLGEAAEILQKGLRPSRPAVAITFDDGFRDFYHEAFPLLKQYGFSATMFLPTRYISNSGKTFLGRPMLSWGQVRELQKEGMRFGSHSVTHRKLVRLGCEELLEELEMSRREIEDQTGVEVNSFSYPYALPDQNKGFLSMLGKLLRQAGYCQGVSTRIGVATPKDPVYFLKRIPVNRWDDDVFFRSKLSGAYDWVFGFQKIYKKLKGSS